MKENYQKSKATLLAELSSSETGLSSAQANKNQEKYGKNELIEEKSKSIFMIFLEQFKDLLYLLPPQLFQQYSEMLKVLL